MQARFMDSYAYHSAQKFKSRDDGGIQIKLEDEDGELKVRPTWMEYFIDLWNTNFAAAKKMSNADRMRKDLPS